MNSLVRPAWILSLLVVSLVALAPRLVQAERPTAPHLLPRDTLAYFRIHDVPELKKLFQETTAGKLAADEQIRPLLGQLWASAAEAFQPIEDELGLSLNELSEVPQGEFCVALVAPEQGRPALVMLLDVADQRDAADRLLERAERAMTDSGAVKSIETHREVELRIYQFAGDGNRQVVQFEREGLIAMLTNLELAKAVLDVWDGQQEDAKTLADNRKFTAIMKRSAGTRDERPQLAWYVDPLELAKRAGRGNLGFQAGLALLAPLGLDGFQAVGGSVILGGEEFDSIVHLHVSLAAPRKGALNVVAMQSGDTTPEAWVPRDAASYMTMHWDMEQSYAAIEEVYDLVRGEGEWATLVQQQVSDRLGADLRKNLVGGMRGRISMLTWMEKPARLNSQSRIIGMQLKDPAAFRATLDDIMNKFAANWDKRSYGGQTYFSLRVPEGGPQGPQGNQPLMRRPELLVSIQDDYVLLSDSTKLLEHVIQSKSNPSNSLADELEFKLIASKIKRHAGGEKPGMIYFDRPEEGMRLLYDLVTGDTTRQRLGQAAESNGFFQALNDALNDNPLPPFHQIARYLAPRGGMVINDSTGIHYTMFGMRRETK